MEKVRIYRGIIVELKENQILVFGSNPLGYNGNPHKGTGGAALLAYNIAGVRQGEKMNNRLSDSGKAWGITTVTRPGAKRSKTLLEIQLEIVKLYLYAMNHIDKDFLVAYRGRDGYNLNGYTNKELASLFSSYPIPNNIIFELEFSSLLEQQLELI